MKFIIATEELNRLVGNIQAVAAQRGTIPILSNLLLEADNDQLILTATDLTVGTRCFARAKVLEKGATTLPAKRLWQLIKELSAGTIELSSANNEISEIVAGTSRFKLNGMSCEEYPSFPELDGAIQFKTQQGKLREMLQKTAFCVSKEDSRYILTGVLMRLEEGRATFVGTDGKRLAMNHTNVEVDESLQGDYVIPIKAIEELLKVLKESEEEVNIYLMGNKIAVTAENVTIVTKLLAGDFPDFARVIPQEAQKEVVLHRDELISLLRQISLFTGDSSHSVRFTFVEGELQLTANNSHIGEGRVSMPVDYKGELLEIAFNPNFFLDILRHSKDESVNLGVIDSYSPGVIKDSSEALFVIMPMRLSE
jgi:DNA polymerase III subunit beta